MLGLGTALLLTGAAVSSAREPRAAPAWHNTSWLNTDRPLTLESLRGRVVLLNLWEIGRAHV